MKLAWILNAAFMAVMIVAIAVGTNRMVASAGQRLATGESAESTAKKPQIVVTAAELEYCTDSLKTVLRRVLTNCGLIGGGRKGCQPGQLKNVAQIDDKDFNALFSPLQARAGVILFDKGKEDLDVQSRALVEKLWADQRGANYFFVVARASTDGSTEANRALSHNRANSVMFAIKDKFKMPDADLEQSLGLLWLGEEYAQLGTDYCKWQTSRPGVDCKAEDINRSAIISWIDCRL
jgi:outer membrane protein OmpA-like peptidoglycan-associated protein